MCVLGTFDDEFQVTDRVADVTVSGIMFAGWPSMGVFAYGTQDLRLINNAVFGAGEYGLARFDSLGGVVKDNTVVGGGEAGIYVGDSADANAKVTHNEVSGSAIGIFIRHSSGITVQLNHAYDNCQGIFVLDDGQGGVSDIELKYNYVTFNNAACPASDEGPPLAGGGILLVGAARLARRVEHGPRQHRHRDQLGRDRADERQRPHRRSRSRERRDQEQHGVRELTGGHLL